MARIDLVRKILKVLLVLLISAPAVSLSVNQSKPPMQPGLTAPVVSAQPPAPAPDSQPITPAVEPPEGRKFECPKTRYINCMPPVQEIFKPMCTEEYLEWAKRHCTGFEVVY